MFTRPFCTQRRRWKDPARRRRGPQSHLDTQLKNTAMCSGLRAGSLHTGGKCASLSGNDPPYDWSTGSGRRPKQTGSPAPTGKDGSGTSATSADLHLLRQQRHSTLYLRPQDPLATPYQYPPPGHLQPPCDLDAAFRLHCAHRQETSPQARRRHATWRNRALSTGVAGRLALPLSNEASGGRDRQQGVTTQ